MKQIGGEQNKIGDTLTTDQVQELQRFGALDWEPRDIAIYFNFDIKQFTFEYSDADSIVCLIVTRGRLQSLAAISTKLLNNAEAGDTPSIAQIQKINRDKSFKTTKLDIFGGFEDEESYQRLSDYIATGASKDLSTKEQLYIDLLHLVFSLSKQHDRRYVIKFLTRTPHKISYARAVDIYDEAVNLFYSNRRITKEALRQKYADDLESWANMVAKTATCAADYDIAGNLKAKAAKILRLDQSDPEQLPPSQYIRPIRLLSLDSSDVNLPPANRDDLARQIESVLAPDAVKKRLRMEAGIEDIDFIEILNVAQEEN